jgi:hypothetical protein
MKRLRGRPYSFQKLIQFSQWNIVLDPPAPNIDAFLTGETGLVPFIGKELFGTKVMLLTFEITEIGQYFFQN